jgi:hypothetical protein
MPECTIDVAGNDSDASFCSYIQSCMGYLFSCIPGFLPFTVAISSWPRVRHEILDLFKMVNLLKDQIDFKEPLHPDLSKLTMS